MRKLSPRFRAWIFNRRRNEERRRRHHTTVRIYGVGGRIEGTAPRKVEQLPKNFCLDTNRDEVVKFLESLRSRFARGTKNRAMPRRAGRIRAIGSYFDFAAIEKITPAAALILAAEYDRGRLRSWTQAHAHAAASGGKVDPNANPLSLINVDRWNPQVVSSLAQLGFFHLLDIQQFIPTDLQSNESILPFVSGSRVEPDELAWKLTEKLKDLLQSLELPNEETVTHLHGRIIEAIQNVRDHAYPPGISLLYPTVGRWWATASVDLQQKRLDVIVYDQGITIPGSIPRSPKRDIITQTYRKLFGRNENFGDTKYDGEAIRAAIESGKTQTEAPHRGKGLIFMQDLISYCSHGELHIHSRNGVYRHMSNSDDKISTHDTSIGGTLIEWRLYL